MKNTVRTAVLFLVAFLLFSVSLSAQKTEYQIGESEGGLLTDERVKAAFRSAVEKFKAWAYEGVPSGHVTQTDGYYLQSYTDGEDRSAAIYVGADYRPYVLRGPIYDQLKTLGGFVRLGLPVSDAFEVKGGWYQNFERGYAKTDKNGKAVFVEGKSVTSDGTERPLSTDGDTRTDPGGSTASQGADGTTDGDGLISTASQFVSDAVEQMGNGDSRIGIFILALVILPAILILLVYLFLKRK